MSWRSRPRQTSPAREPARRTTRLTDERTMANHQSIADSTVDITPEQFLAEARKNRLDLRAARSRIALLDEQYDVVKWQRWTGDAALTAEQEQETDGARPLGAAFEIELPVFTSMKTRSRAPRPSGPTPKHTIGNCSWPSKPNTHGSRNADCRATSTRGLSASLPAQADVLAARYVGKTTC